MNFLLDQDDFVALARERSHHGIVIVIRRRSRGAVVERVQAFLARSVRR